MEDKEQLPCTNCRALVDLREPDCPHCGADLLVDVLVQARSIDSRLRYRLSRAVQGVPGAPPLAEIQKALMGSPAAAARGVTRGVAHELLPVLAANGVRASIAKRSRPASSAGGFPLGTILKASTLVALLAVGYVGWSKLTSRPPAPPAPVASQTRPAPAARIAPPTLSARELARAGLQAAVSLRCANSVGSGFFVAPDLVLTNAHVLCEDDSIQVKLADDRTLAGAVERRSKRVDLALVRVAGANGRALPLGDVADLAVADRVTIVGSPVGLDFSVQEGSISSLRRTADGVAYIQLDAKVSPGNSGGPIIDALGRAVGIVSMKLTGEGVEGIGLALPINYAYGSELGFVPPPSPEAGASPAFGQMLAAASKNDDGALAEVDAATAEPPTREDDRPLLVGAYINQYGHLVIRAVRVTVSQPGYEEVAVHLWSGLDSFCTIKGDIRDWNQVDASSAGSGFDPRVARALNQLARGGTMFAGESQLRWDLCPREKVRPGMEVELEGANPIASRLRTR